MKKSLAFLSLITIFFSCKQKNPYATDIVSIKKGKELFEQNCTACHNFKSSGIGPNLAGVTKKTSYEWLQSFIKNPQKLIEQGDERAVKLFQEYKTYMASFDYLKEEDIHNILAYLNTQTQTPQLNSKNDYGKPLQDPIPDTINSSGLTLELKYLFQAPQSQPKKPLARINKMFPTPDGKQLLLSDLNGTLYNITDHKTTAVLKLQDHFKNFISKPGLGTGFGSFAFHPEFQSNGLFYTSHAEKIDSTKTVDFSYHDSIPAKLHWVVTAWKLKPKNLAIENLQKELLRIPMPTRIHGMQEITFNPTAKKNDKDYGLLYISVGDGGSAENGYLSLTQDLNAIWGSILRIDPLGNNSKNGKYGIPKDNPFVTTPKANGEIWAYGFRNPHRITWHPKTKQMLASEIGHHQIEEVNLIEKGKNYGWPIKEGTFAIYTDTNMKKVYPYTQKDLKFTDPIIQFDHDEGNAVSGGFVYQGKNIPELQNKYLFGTIVRGRLLITDSENFKSGKINTIEEVSLSLDQQSTDAKKLTKSNRTDVRLGIDGEGELYLFTKADGKVYKIIGATQS